MTMPGICIRPVPARCAVGSGPATTRRERASAWRDRLVRWCGRQAGGRLLSLLRAAGGPIPTCSQPARITVPGAGEHGESLPRANAGG